MPNTTNEENVESKIDSTQAQELLSILLSRTTRLKEQVEQNNPEKVLKIVMDKYKKVLKPLENLPGSETLKDKLIEKAMGELNILQPSELFAVYKEIYDSISDNVIQSIVEDFSEETNKLYARLVKNLEELRLKISNFETKVANEKEVYAESTINVMYPIVLSHLIYAKNYAEKILDEKGVSKSIYSKLTLEDFSDEEQVEIRIRTIPYKRFHLSFIGGNYKIEKLAKSLDATNFIPDSQTKSMHCKVMIGLRSEDKSIFLDSLKKLITI